MFGTKRWLLPAVLLVLPLPVPTKPPTALPAGPPAATDAPGQAGQHGCAWFVPLNDNTANALYLEQHVYYWVTRLPYAPGASLTVHGRYPHARYFSFTAYDPRTKAISSLYDARIAPDAGSSNPYLPNADRTVASRDYTVRVTFNTSPKPPPAG